MYQNYYFYHKEMRPIDLIKQLFGSISPAYLNEAIDPFVKVGEDLVDPRLIEAASREAGDIQPEWVTSRFAGDINPQVVTTVNLDPRQAAKLVQDAAAGSGRIARETSSKSKNKDLEYSRYGRGSNTQINSIRQAEDAFGRKFDIDNPITLYGSSPVFTGLKGSSSFDLVIPQTKQIAEFVDNRFDPNKLINPLIISDGNQYKGFLPVDRVSAANLNPRRVITGDEQKNKVLKTLNDIIESPYIPTAAKEQLLKVTQNDIFGGIKTIDDNLGLDFGALEKFASALRNDKSFTEGLRNGEYDELVWLSKQMSGAKALDNTLNNQYTRLKSDNLLAGMAFDYNPETGLFFRTPYEKPAINLDGATFKVDQKSLAKQIAAANQQKERYISKPIGEGQFPVDYEQTNLTGKTPFAKQIGQGNVIFSKELVDPNAVQGIQMGYVSALENGINELLKRNVKTVQSADGDVRTFLKKETLPQLTPDLPAGTLGYTVVPETVEGSNSIRNVPRLGLVTKDPKTGTTSIQLARQDRPILFSNTGNGSFTFVDEKDIWHPLGDIQHVTERIKDDGTKQVVDELIFPSPIASLVAGRIQYNRPDELENINLVFGEGEDKLKALARLATTPIPEPVNGLVEFPVAMKRLARKNDNFLASELPDDAQSQLLAQALNFGSPNFGNLTEKGINPIPGSNVAKALKVNILDEPTAVTVMPISWDIKNQTDLSWDDLYAEQLIDPQGKVAESIVIPYNEAVDNPKLLSSVLKAYKNRTGIEPELKWLDTPDGNTIAYIGNTPNQVRSFPDWSDPERGREPLFDTRKLDNSLLRWLGINDERMTGEIPMSPSINTQNVDQVLYEITDPDNGSVYDKQYVREDRPLEVFKNPRENFGTGLGAYDERSGDLYNVGDPKSVRGANYSVALQTFFDPRTQGLVEVPEIFRTPEFLRRYKDDNYSLTLDTDEVDALQRWVDEHVEFGNGEPQSATPFGMLWQEARDHQSPIVYREKAGTAADDIRRTHITSDGSSIHLPSRRNTQIGLDPNEVTEVRTTYYPPASKVSQGGIYDPNTGQFVPPTSVRRYDSDAKEIVGRDQEGSFNGFQAVTTGGQQPFAVTNQVVIPEGSVRSLYPNAPISYDADGKVVKVYHPLWSNGVDEPKYSTAVNSAAIRNFPENIDPNTQMLDTRLAGLFDRGAAIRNNVNANGNTVYSYNEYLDNIRSQASQLDNEIMLLGNRANSERDATKRQEMIAQINELKANRALFNPVIRQEDVFNSYNDTPAEEYYSNMMRRNMPPLVDGSLPLLQIDPNLYSTPEGEVKVAQLVEENLRRQRINEARYYVPEKGVDGQQLPIMVDNYLGINTDPSFKEFSIPANAFTVTRTEPLWQTPSGAIVRETIPPIGNEVTRSHASSGQLFNMVDASNSLPLLTLNANLFSTPEGKAKIIQLANENLRRQSSDLPLFQITPNLFSTPEGKAQAIQLAKENLRRQRINEARQSILDARINGQQLSDMIDYNLARGISEEETLYRLKNVQYAKQMLELARLEEAFKAKPILKPNPLEGLNITESDMRIMEQADPYAFMGTSMSDGTSVSDPYNLYDSGSGWGESGQREAIVTPQDPMPYYSASSKYDPQFEGTYVVDRDGNKFVYVPDNDQRRMQDELDKEIIASRVQQQVVPDSELVDSVLDNRFVIDQNILDSERQFYPPIESVRPLSPLQQENRDLTSQIIANSPQNVARRNEVARQANMNQQPVVANTQAATQPVVVNQPQPVVEVITQPQATTQQPTAAVRTEQSNSTGVPEATQGFDWNTLSQEQKLMLLGLGGLGAYGLYDAFNQPQQQSYAVRAA